MSGHFCCWMKLKRWTGATNKSDTFCFLITAVKMWNNIT